MDNNKTQKQLLKENDLLKSRISELKQSETERKKIETALQESEEKFRNMIQNLMEAFYSATLDGKLLFYSDEFVRMLGLDSKKDYIGIELPDFWQHSGDRKAYIDELMSKGFIKNYIVNAKKSNGEKIIVQVNSRLIKDREEKPSRIEGTFLDITEQKKAEEALWESEKKLLKVQEIAKVGFLNLNFETNEMFLSDRVVDLYKLEAGKNWFTPEFVEAIVHPDDLERAKKNLELLAEGKTPHNIDHRVIRTDGEIIWVHARHEIIYDNVGKPNSLLGTIVDITERKRAEEELKKHREHLEEMVEEKTKELEDKNKELDSALKVFVGRELKIRDLENKIDALEGR